MNAPNFNRLAHLYRWMELASFGPFLWWCRCAFLCEMAASRRALVLGDGDGRFTARLLRTNPEIRVDAVDASPKMLQALERRAHRHADRLRTFAADARELHLLPLAQDGAGRTLPRYDLVVTHFFLDCLTTEEIEELARSLRPLLAEDAQWITSEFALPEGRMGRIMAGSLISFLYWAFRLLTGLPVRRLPDHAAALRQAGFTLAHQRRWLGGLLLSERWQWQSHF